VRRKIVDFPARVRKDAHTGSRSHSVKLKPPTRDSATLAKAQISSTHETLEMRTLHKADWHWFWRETVNRLDSLQQRVNEGKDLDAAVEFARFVLWSKMADLLKPQDCDGMLKVDSAFLRWKAEELQRSVCDAYRTGKAAPRGEQGQLDAIGHKLDIIAGQLSKLQPQAEQAASMLPALHVVSSGA
jgi:hypothetical protein